MISSSPIAIACDHAAYPLKQKILSHFKESYTWKDLGCFSEESVDYPSYADEMAKSLYSNSNSQQLGILLCGSGQGMNMRINKYSFIRAALCWDIKSVQLAKEHNHANVLCLGARFLNESLCFKMIETFICTPCSKAERHCRRVEAMMSPLPKKIK